MAQTILIKRSTGTVTPTSLENGELAYSASSNKLFIGRPGGTSGDIDSIGGKYYTDIITEATAANTASKLVLRDGSGNFSAGTITATFSGNATTATTLATVRNFSASGDLTAPNVSFNGGGAVDLVTTLATVNSNVGSFGGTTAIPVITVNAKGLVTAASTVAISSTLDIAADTGTDNGVLIGTDTLTVSGGTGVDTSVSGDTITVAIGQAVATTSNVTFNNVSVDGTLSSDDITAATMTASGHVVVQGNLTVSGTTTTVNSTTVELGDNTLLLNKQLADNTAPTANAGFEVYRGTGTGALTNTSLLWNETADYWQINDGSTVSKIMTANNFASSFTGILDGGTY